MRYRIERACRIAFAEPVREHHVRIALSPWDDELQSLTRLDLRTTPEAVAVARCDGFGNLTHGFAVLAPHRELGFTLTAEVETHLSNPFDLTPVEPAREPAWIKDSLHQAPRLWDFVLHQGALTPGLPKAIGERPRPDWEPRRPLLAQIRDAFAWVAEVAEYDPEAREPVASLLALFDAGRGTAADLAHLLIALLRSWGVPARFVSGYLDAGYFNPDDDAPPGAEPRPQTLHSWAEALIPGAGWRGFDPALGLLADETYIRVAVGRDAGDVKSLRHTSKGSGEPPVIAEALQVTRLDAQAGTRSDPLTAAALASGA